MFKREINQSEHRKLEFDNTPQGDRNAGKKATERVMNPQYDVRVKSILKTLKKKLAHKRRR